MAARMYGAQANLSRQAWAGKKQALSRTAATARVCIAHIRACTGIPRPSIKYALRACFARPSLQLTFPTELTPLPHLSTQPSLELAIRLRRSVSQLLALQYIFVATVSL